MQRKAAVTRNDILLYLKSYLSL